MSELKFTNRNPEQKTDPWKVKDALHAKSSEWLKIITETDWRKASASSLVGVVDQIYDNEFVRLYQQYQSFINNSIQNTQHDSLVVELVLVSKEGSIFVLFF